MSVYNKDKNTIRTLRVIAEVLATIDDMQSEKPEPRHTPRRERKPRHKAAASDYNIVKVLESETFDSGRLKVLRKWSHGPLSTKEAVEVIGTFTFRSNQEKVAKMLAPSITDKWAYEHALREELGFAPWFRV